jgi:hypothetical protein
MASNNKIKLEDILIGLYAFGTSILAARSGRERSTSQDSVSKAYVQGGFYSGTSAAGMLGVNPLLWVGVALIAVFLLFGRKRR